MVYASIYANSGILYYIYMCMYIRVQLFEVTTKNITQ